MCSEDEEKAFLPTTISSISESIIDIPSHIKLGNIGHGKQSEGRYEMGPHHLTVIHIAIVMTLSLNLVILPVFHVMTVAAAQFLHTLSCWTIPAILSVVVIWILTPAQPLPNETAVDYLRRTKNIIMTGQILGILLMLFGLLLGSTWPSLENCEWSYHV